MAFDLGSALVYTFDGFGSIIRIILSVSQRFNRSFNHVQLWMHTLDVCVTRFDLAGFPFYLLSLLEPKFR